MVIKICIGSSCHLKGSETIVNMFQKAVEENNLTEKVTLCGSFCLGYCNREGVTVQIDEEVFTGITPTSFDRFFTTTVLKKLEESEKV